MTSAKASVTGSGMFRLYGYLPEYSFVILEGNHGRDERDLVARGCGPLFAWAPALHPDLDATARPPGALCSRGRARRRPAAPGIGDRGRAHHGPLPHRQF